jgi:Txe/YoeB family toxin of Txe-Axe toxin-antitoxin module
MPKTQQVPVKDLSLDLRNFRIVPQTTEKAAVSAIIAINKERFLGLMESLLEEDGFLPNETLIVIRKGQKLVVKEGNRRVAALKLILSIIKRDPDHIPEKIEKLIGKLTEAWTNENEKVPCIIFEADDWKKVDRLVSLAHGKGEKAGRDPWEAIARARHNRDVNKGNEAGLDMMEGWLKEGRNINDTQRERFGGDYPLTVLNEALQRISPRYKKTPRELTETYPKLRPRTGIEAMLLDIGLNTITFETMRTQNALDNYGLPPLPEAAPTGSSSGSAGNTGTAAAGGAVGGANNGSSANSSDQTGTGANAQANAGLGGKPAAAPLNSQASIMKALGKLKIVGANRDKVVTLRDEARRLKLEKNPLAFCFLLRSMFEISAKAYCKDQEGAGCPKSTRPDGSDRPLASVLRDIAEYIKKSNPGKEMERQLHGAMTELGASDRLLSVDSMNQLVHNPSFTTDLNSICTVFHKILPFLQIMNG